jgi:branched-chain amino acid transport system permease protein
VGISTTKYRLMAFVVSAALAGMAGALYAMNYSSIVPKKFDFNTSINILVYVVLGGMGSIRGGIISATILTILPEKLRFLGDFRMLIYAVVLIGVMLFTNSSTIKQFLEGFVDRVRHAQDDEAAVALPDAPPEGGGTHE